MSLLSRYLDDVYIAWLSSAMGCCGPRLKKQQNEPVRGIEKPMTVLHHQPQLIPPPIPESQNQSRPQTRSSSQEWLSRTRSFASRTSSRGSFSVKRKLNMYNGYNRVRRPHIGPPSDFRHVEQALPQRRRSFRPLELSIYMPNSQLSPLLPLFDLEDRTSNFSPTSPTHTRSASAMSNFSIPRKAVGSHYSVHARLESAHTTPESVTSEFGRPATHPLRPRPSLPESLSTQELIAALERELPQYPAPARLRANTMPVLNEQVERVKSVLQEKDELDRKIRDLDNMIEERQSLHIKSRPGSIYPTSEAAEPMPEVKRSDVEILHLHSLPRPKTAPSRPTVHIPHRSKSFDEASSAFSSASTTSPPPPPLPLILPRPPLRKKKSFSRVSSWLFPSEHARHISIDSITNTPVPVTARDGFYQCVDTRPARVSASSVSTLQSTLDWPTVPTSWTESESPARSTPTRCEGDGLARMATFGARDGNPSARSEAERLGQRVSRVGVAF